MPMCRVLCCWKRVFAMTSAFSWQTSISLCPASFCTPRPNLPVTPGVSWLPTFAFQSPIMKRTSFWGVVLDGLVGLHRTVQLQLLQCYWLGHRLGLQNEAGQRLTEFCQENALVIANTLFQQHKRRLYNAHHQTINTKIRLMIFFVAKDGDTVYSQQKQTVAQIMNSLFPNSDLNWRK